MTKDEAISAMAEGKKVAHEYFTADEWMERHGNGYRFEDGVECPYSEFWHYRRDDGWQTGWRIVK